MRKKNVCRHCGTPDHVDFAHSAWSMGCPKAPGIRDYLAAALKTFRRVKKS